ncbi:extracellular matrix protein 1-like [Myxocyprinus asiaticus]|uniref:extracellular matrix protein 1-like n=1 Tax=Myxocyprinus asiaticus TaxID=70543 RepID=UPI002222D876|nr:extracellular matrix protein 1-like [Myxocyprinus asiaticus]
MGSSPSVGLFLILSLVLVCDASGDMEQRPVTHLLDEEMLQAFSPEERQFLQRPIIPDISEMMKLLASSEADMNPREDTNFHLEDVTRERRVFSPRSMRLKMGPQILFPPAFPTIGNLKDICTFSKGPVRYPKGLFPTSGFGSEHRRGDAVNRLQPWYGVCCGLNQTPEEQICCAKQAWRKTLSDFCSEEFSIKTSHYSCCHKRGQARWTCFDKEASDSSYNLHISSEISNANTPQKVKGFKYNPNACKGLSSSSSLLASPRAFKKMTGVPDINFPLGRPDSSNIALICAHRKIRPRYTPKCLPRTGYGWLARQSKAINVLEKEFNHCCKEKNGVQRCAERKWKRIVDIFCKVEKKTKGKQFECCEKKKGEEQYACFASAAPDPGYSFIDGVFTPLAAPPTINAFCDMSTTIQNMTSFRFSLDQMVERCCSLVLQERPACIDAELDSHLNDLCKVKELVKPHCCEPKIKNRAKCATKLLLRSMAKANKIKDSRRKKCPLSS